MSRIDEFLTDLNKKQPTPVKRDRQWRPVLGQWLEYGDSGFIIVLQKDSKKGPYRLQDPDGRILAEGDMLPKYKEYAEQQTRFRDEFDLVPEQLAQLPDFSKFGSSS